MKQRYFCTLFDSNYLVKGLAMIRSLAHFCPDMRIYVLCMDERARTILERQEFEFVECISLSDVEDDELLEAKADRGVAEYCWTLSSCFTWYVMQNYPHIGMLTYLDSDLLFFSDVGPVFDEIGKSSIAIIEHRFTPRLKDREINGRFCVQWVSFRRDGEGLACLSRWRDQCIDWCYYRLEDGKMGDQKYLDEWPVRYPSCHIIQNLGAGVAPWNYSQYTFSTHRGQHLVSGSPLIFYHFHQFQILDDGTFDRLSTFYTKEKMEPQGVYETYESAIMQALSAVRLIEPTFSCGLKPASEIRRLRWIQGSLPHSAKWIIKKFIRYKI